MLDLKFVVQNIETVQKNIDHRFLEQPPDVRQIAALYKASLAIKQEIDILRQQRNQNAAAAKALDKMEATQREIAKQEIMAHGKKIKEALTKKEKIFAKLDSQLQQKSLLLPNMVHPDVPVGKADTDSKELYVVGQIPQFEDFRPKDHVELMQQQGWIDFENAAKVTGAKHYYLCNQAVFLEMSLTRFAADILQKHGFSMCITPDLAREEILAGTGFQPRGEESNTYMIQDEHLCLIGTAEVTLGGLYSNQIVDLSKPILLGGISHCFRKEAGAAGQYSKGLYRVHQFSKVEMFILCKPEDSSQMHQKLLAIEEEIFQALEIPYRVLDICTGDLGAPAYRKFDLEAWMPGRHETGGENGSWGEITSASNCTDYQARRLGIRYRNEEGKNVAVHTLNGTALALSRAIVALIENHQQADTSIRIPAALQPYMGCKQIGQKNT